MSATEVLRRLLDELEVEWEDCGNGVTYVEHNGEAWRFDYDEAFNELVIVCLSGYTPEQAIAATLGRGNVGRYVGLRRGKYWERLENSDYYCGGCGWKVTDHDSYCPECGGALHEATLGDIDATSGRYGGTGMCHNSAPSYLDFLCSECGFVHYHSDTNDTGDGNEWCFCPNCGAEVVDE